MELTSCTTTFLIFLRHLADSIRKKYFPREFLLIAAKVTAAYVSACAGTALYAFCLFTAA